MTDLVAQHAVSLAGFSHSPLGFIGWAFGDRQVHRMGALLLWSLVTRDRTMGFYVCDPDEWEHFCQAVDAYVANHPVMSDKIHHSEKCVWVSGTLGWRINRIPEGSHYARFAGLMNAGQRIVMGIGSVRLDEITTFVMRGNFVAAESECVAIRDGGVLMLEREA